MAGLVCLNLADKGAEVRTEVGLAKTLKGPPSVTTSGIQASFPKGSTKQHRTVCSNITQRWGQFTLNCDSLIQRLTYLCTPWLTMTMGYYLFIV